MPVIEPGVARAFAAEWIDAWNAHDLERILGHYAARGTVAESFHLDASGKVRSATARYGVA